MGQRHCKSRVFILFAYKRQLKLSVTDRLFFVCQRVLSVVKRVELVSDRISCSAARLLVLYCYFECESTN